MWAIANETPFATERSWVRDTSGAEVWMVAVRCTYTVDADGGVSIAQEQAPVAVEPEYLGRGVDSSLRYDTDFVLTKPTTDVVLHGSAHAPYGQPSRAVNVSLRLGAVHKELQVIGERNFESSLFGVRLGPPAPFVTAPICYERSFGGGKKVAASDVGRQCDPRNPVGTGWDPVPGSPAPSVVYPSGDQCRPASFGPIPPQWEPRCRYAGTYDKEWLDHRYPLYPHDLDPRFFLCSPEDQLPAAHLRGGESVELINLTPAGRLAFTLPRVALGFETFFRSGERLHHKASLDTVVIEPTVGRVILVLCSRLPCHSMVNALEVTVVRQKRVIT